MGKMKIEGEDIEDLGLTLVGEDVEVDIVDPDDVAALLIADPNDTAIIEGATVPPVAADVPSDHPAVADDVEEDLLSQLEAILSPQSMAPGEDSEDTPVSARKSPKKQNDDGEEDDSLGAVKPRQKDEIHCGRCWILVKATIHKCPVDDDICPVICARKK